MDAFPHTPPSLPATRSDATLAVLSLVLGGLAIVLSPVLVGAVAGAVGLILALVHLARSPDRRALAWWGSGLCATGLALSVALGCLYAVLITRALPAVEEGATALLGGGVSPESEAQATYTDSGVIGDQGAAKAKSLSCFCLDREDNILACDEGDKCVRVIAPDNTLKATWKLDFGPQAIAHRDDGTSVVAGGGKVAILDATGTVLATGSLPAPPVRAGVSGSKSGEAMRRYQTAATAAAWTGEDIFVCARAGTGYTIYRLNAKLGDVTAIVKGLQGCCGQLDVTARDGAVYAAANCDFKVIKYDRDGKKLGSFGKTGKGPEACFDGCCEPKNLCFGPDGSLYLAGSGRCSISRYSVAGKFLDYVGKVKGIAGCVRVTVAVNRDASRVYMLDTDRNVIRILARKAPVLPAVEAPKQEGGRG